MIDPRLFASVPFKNPTAWVDFTGTFFLYHRALVDRIFATTSQTIRLGNLGDGGGAPWLLALQRQHEAEAAALGLDSPPSFVDYDLRNAEDFASFMFLLSEDLVRLRQASGLS